MKIKEVCELTMLSDRTIRYYIEEDLISPTYTENYLGRKAYNFSSDDVKQLCDIATLRKYDFSVSEIKTMISHPDEIINIVNGLEVRKSSSVAEESKLLRNLSNLDKTKSYTVALLASALCQPCVELAPPKNDEQKKSKIILSLIKKVLWWLVVLAPVILASIALFDFYHSFEYPKFSQSTAVFLALLLLPSLLLVTISAFKTKHRAKKVITAILLSFSILLTPINFYFTLFTMQESETSNHHNYRKLDTQCRATNDQIFQELFPVKLNYKTPSYYYNFCQSPFGDVLQVYAEWKSTKDSIENESVRIQCLFEKHGVNDQYKFTIAEHGNYTCYVLYYGNALFENVTKDYSYYIYAYNCQSNTVRYIHCYSDTGGVEQPYYLSLKW